MAVQPSEAINTQRTVADSLCVCSDQWTAGGSETSAEFFDFGAFPATRDMHDTLDVSFSDQINMANSIRSSSTFTISDTENFQPTQLRTTVYITNGMNTIDARPGHLSDRAINWMGAANDIHLEISNGDFGESLQSAKDVVMICNLNQSLAAEVENLEAAEPVQDGLSKRLVAAN